MTINCSISDPIVGFSHNSHPFYRNTNKHVEKQAPCDGYLAVTIMFTWFKVHFSCLSKGYPDPVCFTSFIL